MLPGIVLPSKYESITACTIITANDKNLAIRERGTLNTLNEMSNPTTINVSTRGLSMIHASMFTTNSKEILRTGCMFIRGESSSTYKKKVLIKLGHL